MKKRVSIVVVNWNGKNDTLVALSSLRKMNKAGHDVSVIVVDNGSTNDSAPVIAKAHPWVSLIETGKNLGFTGGNNVGMKVAMRSGADFVWLLNNDVIAHKDALSILGAFGDNGVGLAGSKIYFASGKEYHKDRYSKNQQGKVLWYAGGLVDWDNMYASHRGVDEVDSGRYDEPEETPFITGCSMMVRSEVIKKIGFLDEKFYLYLEDLDYCLRARRAGYRLLYVPSSIIWHVNAGSSGGPGNPMHEYYFTRNRLLVGMRYAPVRTKIALVKEAMKFVIVGSSVKKKAVLDALMGRFGKQYEPRKF